MDTALSKSKAGFGLVEVLVSMVILALMFTGVMVMNYSNHNTALRIATRNEASQIGQRVIDSLSALGLSGLPSGTNTVTIMGDSSKTVGTAFSRQYRCIYKVTDINSTQGTTEGAAPISVTLVRAKKVELNVEWTLDRHTNSINLNTVVE